MTEKPRKDAMLSYAQGEPKTRKIVFRCLWVALIIAISAWSVWKILPELELRRRILTLQQILADSTMPPTYVVFKAEQTGENSGGYSGCGDGNWSKFRRLCSAPAARKYATLYSHRIADRHGHELLIEIRFVPGALDAMPGFLSDVVQPGTLWSYPSVASVVVRPFDFGLTLHELSVGNLKIYSGQPDPADPSHFTIDYDLNGQRHTLDGQIDDQDVLTIQKRKEPTTIP